MEIEANLGYSLGTDICCDKLEEISYLKIFPECLRRPLKTLWRATFGPRGAICPPLLWTKLVEWKDLCSTQYRRKNATKERGQYATQTEYWRCSDQHKLGAWLLHTIIPQYSWSKGSRFQWGTKRYQLTGFLSWVNQCTETLGNGKSKVPAGNFKLSPTAAFLCNPTSHVPQFHFKK